MFQKLRKNGLLKRWDFILISSLALFSFIPLIIFTIQQVELEKKTDKILLTAIISVGGEEIKQFELNDADEEATFRYEAPDGDYNLIQVKNNKIAITEASCDDQLCVRMGTISKPGETIVCLPHQLVIEIKASDGNQSGSLVY